jgi:transcriptional regulator of acetoin/glycerol metabolism
MSGPRRIADGADVDVRSWFASILSAAVGSNDTPTTEKHEMTIPHDFEARILRYYHVEKWRAGTIATQLGVHRNTVLRVIG